MTAGGPQGYPREMAGSEVCRVCSALASPAFSAALLGRPVRYFDCAHCGYFQTQYPDWLEEAYRSPINAFDTGIVRRNRLNLGRVVMTLAAFGLLHGRVVDHAGGCGLLVRLLRDAGIDARWRDKYSANLLARGFEDDGRDQVDLVSAFEVLEHMVDPLGDLGAMIQRAPVVLLSTELIRDEMRPSPTWWYLGPEHGQHIGFFRKRTLHWITSHLHCHTETYGDSVHLFSRKPIPRRWRTCMKLRRLAPLITRARLHPLTQNDFDALRRASHDGRP